MIACFRAWGEEHKQVELERERNAELARSYLHDVPRLVVDVRGEKGPEAWVETASKKIPPVSFFLNHIAGRAATDIYFEPITSSLGKFSMHFDPITLIRSGERQILEFEIWEDGIPVADDIVRVIGLGELLLLFVRDRPSGQGSPVYEVVIRFRDQEAERCQKGELIFDAQKYQMVAKFAPSPQ